MLYVETTAIVGPNSIEPCYEPGPPECGGGGGGSENTVPVEEVQKSSLSFLALKTIYTPTDHDQGGDEWELQMYVDAVAAVAGYTFERRWNYTFDRKYGRYGIPLAWGEGKWWQIALGSLLIATRLIFGDKKATLNTEFGSIFSGFNKRTLSVDGRVYETPDVDNDHVNYNFTNMRTWEGFPRLTGPKVYKYVEVAKHDFFPVVLLNDETFSLVLVEDDKKYPIMSTLTGGSENKYVETFNMSSGQYENKLITIDAYNHLTGNSDDILQGTGVSHINKANVNGILDSQGDLAFTAPNGFKYEFVFILREAPVYNPN